jgi:hypothetical protein
MALYQSGTGLAALVGVGTTNPTSNLQVYGTPIAAGNVFSVLNTAASGNVAQFSSSTGTALIINANGNVGIGKTNPGTLLDVNGALTATVISGTTLTASTAHNTSGSGVYQVAGTTVVDSSRNLTNIGTIGSGAITSSSTISGTTITGTTDASFNSVTVGIGSGSVATNTAIGKYALLNNTTGSLNTAVGESAMYTNSTGLQNTALGARAMYYNTGSTNTAVGDQAMFNNTTGVSGTAVGNQTMYTNTTGQYNTAVGQRAMFLTSTGGYNTALGERSMYNNTTGVNNTAVGQNAIQNNITGNNNTAIGKDAGPTTDALTNTTCIGYNATASASNSVIIGNGANVGIGTASPSTIMHILGLAPQVRIQTSTSASDPTISLYDGSGNKKWLAGYSGTGTYWYMQNDSKDVFRVYTGTSADLFVQPSGGNMTVGQSLTAAAYARPSTFNMAAAASGPATGLSASTVYYASNFNMNAPSMTGVLATGVATAAQAGGDFNISAGNVYDTGNGANAGNIYGGNCNLYGGIAYCASSAGGSNTKAYAGHVIFYTGNANGTTSTDTNSTQRMIILGGSGYVGIGTNPGYPLDVSGDMHCSGAFYCGNNSGATTAGSIGGRMYFGGTYGDGSYTEGGQILSRLYATTESSELVIFKGNDVAGSSGPDRIRLRAGLICFDTYPAASSDPAAENIRMTIDGSGNVGIGTASPGALLDVQGGSIRVHNPGSSTSTIEFKRSSDNWNPATIQQQYNTGGYGGDLAFQLHPADSTLATAPVTVMYLKAGGNVGIGTTNPGYALDVNGIIATRNDIRWNGTGLNAADKKLYSPADGDLEWMTNYGAGGHGFAVSHQGTKYVYLNISGNSYLNGGSVGIGTANPIGPSSETVMLHIRGSSSSVYTLLHLDTTGNNVNAGIKINSAAGYNPFIDFVVGNTFKYNMYWDSVNNYMRFGSGALSYFTGPISVTGDISMTTLNSTINMYRGGIWFAAKNDWNHIIYNNGSNFDGQGIYDGLRLIEYAGFQFYINSTGTVNLTKPVLTINTNGQVNMPLQPAFRAYYGTGASTDITSGILPYNATQVNIGSCYSTSTYKFTAPVAGRYAFGASTYTSAANSMWDITTANLGIIARCEWRVNAASQGVNSIISTTTVVELSAGDTVWVVWADGTVRMIGATKFISFWGHLIG